MIAFLIVGDSSALLTSLAKSIKIDSVVLFVVKGSSEEVSPNSRRLSEKICDYARAINKQR